VASTGEEGDIRDLENHIRQGASLQETAGFLCRAETVEAVAEKAREAVPFTVRLSHENKRAAKIHRKHGSKLSSIGSGLLESGGSSTGPSHPRGHDPVGAPGGRDWQVRPKRMHRLRSITITLPEAICAGLRLGLRDAEVAGLLGHIPGTEQLNAL
jgi:hypothetical protein